MFRRYSSGTATLSQLAAWMDLVLAMIHLADEVERVHVDRVQAEHRLKKLGKAYVDGLYSDHEYRREKRSFEEKLAGLVLPGIDAGRKRESCWRTCPPSGKGPPRPSAGNS